MVFPCPIRFTPLSGTFVSFLHLTVFACILPCFSCNATDFLLHIRRFLISRTFSRCTTHLRNAVKYGVALRLFASLLNHRHRRHCLTLNSRPRSNISPSDGSNTLLYLPSCIRWLIIERFPLCLFPINSIFGFVLPDLF